MRGTAARARRICANVLAIACAAALPAGARAEDPAPPPPLLAPIEVPGAIDDDDAFLEPAITGEAIEIYDRRPDRPFDRDTELRLSGAELARRGATTLAEALDLLPDVVVRTAGRGGEQVEIRGARKGSVKVLIDGVAVSDPYYGTLDVAAIPITDVEQIRLSASPASPLDGVGGPGGVVEIHTRDAVGPRLLAARLTTTTLPSGELAVTGRAGLGRGWAARASATGTLASRDYRLAGAERALAEDRRREVAALRLEHRRGGQRLVADLWLQEGGFATPPGGEEGALQIAVVDGERQGRLGVQLDRPLGRARLQLRAGGDLMTRTTSSYQDVAQEERTARERLRADRAGLGGLASLPLGEAALVIASLALDSEHAVVGDQFGRATAGRASTLGAALGAQLGEGRWRLAAAAGVALPFGIDAEPWPEGKLGLGVRPAGPLDLELTLAHKGRTPTLRERFRLDVGNQALGPERVSSAELAVALVPAPWLRLRAVPWLRRTSGVVRLDVDDGRLVNSGTIDLRGVEAEVHVLPGSPLGGGASYTFTDADAVAAAAMDGAPLDFLPRHRASAWLDGRLAGRASGRLRVRRQSPVVDRGATLPADWQLEASAWARLSAALTASLRVEDVLDRARDERVGVAAIGRVAILSLEATLE